MKREITKAQEVDIQKKAKSVARKLHKLYPNEAVFLAHSSPWELLVSVILSAQATDEQINKVTPKLFKKYPTVESYAKAKLRELEKALYSTGFYRAKAKNTRETARKIVDNFNGEVPQTMEELLTLSGVARKTANIVLQSAFGVVVGIPVDTHVKRFANKYGFSDETDPVKIEQDLMRFFPKVSWRSLSYQLVSYGREYCSARKHDHEQCPLLKWSIED